MTTTLLGGYGIYRIGSTYHQPIYKFQVSTVYEDMKGDIKCRKWGGLGYF